MNKNEKKDLLRSLSQLAQKEDFSFQTLFIVFLSITLFLLFIIPKIYISNHIYYESRKINKLLDDYNILKEENRVLRQKLEYIKYKNNILNSIF